MLCFAMKVQSKSIILLTISESESASKIGVFFDTSLENSKTKVFIYFKNILRLEIHSKVVELACLQLNMP